MNFDFFNLSGVVALTQILLTWFCWSMRKSFASKDSVQKLEQRVAINEVALGNLPDEKTVNDLALAIADLRGDIKGLNAEMKGVTDSVERVARVLTRHEDHLLNGGK
ncbi:MULTISPECIES: DUF2730 family protein [unclassified Maridesulfovibrio]|uniref:DUF2730 family protein n=1 Tax=unclassified Maridesulfovibrio TaxID=2794999 RepID=UPI003B3F677D